MAYTKIHAIKATVDKAIDYICNPEKTDEKMFVSSYACSPETAAYDFKYTLDHCRENSPNKAYHLIQAFAPGEVGFEEAHHIGKELADKVLEGKYSYVVTTHIDKEHVHNHIIFCAADNIEHNKYHDCKQSYYHIRKLSDELCKEHNLSVIIPGAQRGRKYEEWQSDQNGSAWKTQIRKDINFCIRSASTYEEFLLLMRAKGYEIKGETFEEGAAKYISFRPLDKERFVRGSTRSLDKLTRIIPPSPVNYLICSALHTSGHCQIYNFAKQAASPPACFPGTASYKHPSLDKSCLPILPSLLLAFQKFSPE